MSDCKDTYIYAVDFDNTLARTDYPRIIDPIFSVIDYCITLRKRGHTLILWTCRCGQALVDAIEFCKKHGLEFDYINENTPENIEKFGGDSRKIFADYYLDDRARTPWMI